MKEDRREGLQVQNLPVISGSFSSSPETDTSLSSTHWDSSAAGGSILVGQPVCCCAAEEGVLSPGIDLPMKETKH